MLKTITVKGIGSVSTRPDWVELSLSLEALDPDYNKAMLLADTAIRQLALALKGAGFEKEDLKTTNFHVSTEYDSVKDKNGNYKKVFLGYRVSHRLKLGLAFEQGHLADTLGAIAACPARPELGIAFTVKNPAAVQEALLAEATRNAFQKAAVLCQAAGARLGDLLSIDYSWADINVYSNTSYMDMQPKMLLSETTYSPEFEPDDIESRDTASFVWEIFTGN